jgi:retinol dehydrogenase-12
MKGKICLITGASDGLGLEAAYQLARKNAQLILVGRSSQKLESARQAISQATGNKQLTIFTADLSSQKEIRHLSQEIHSRFEKIDVLINNAGSVFAQFLLSEDGIEKTMALNHFSYFLLTRLLLDLLKKPASARIINVASNSHFQGEIDFESFTKNRKYFVLNAYSQSKLANLLFTYELADRLKETAITVNAISPGRIRTKIGNKNQPWYVSIAWTVLNYVKSMSVEKGAKVYTYLASSPEVAEMSGRYFDHTLSPISSSPKSYDKELAKQLWDQSERMILL